VSKAIFFGKPTTTLSMHFLDRSVGTN